MDRRGVAGVIRLVPARGSTVRPGEAVMDRPGRDAIGAERSARFGSFGEVGFGACRFGRARQGKAGSGTGAVGRGESWLGRQI